PRVEYEKEAYAIFEDLKNNIADEAVKGVFRIKIEYGPPPDQQVPVTPGAPAFEPIPSGEMLPQAAPASAAAATLPPPPMAQQRAPRNLHTNRDGEEP